MSCANNLALDQQYYIIAIMFCAATQIERRDVRVAFDLQASSLTTNFTRLDRASTAPVPPLSRPRTMSQCKVSAHFFAYHFILGWNRR